MLPGNTLVVPIERHVLEIVVEALHVTLQVIWHCQLVPSGEVQASKLTAASVCREVILLR